jgi:hypothetical protein
MKSHSRYDLTLDHVFPKSRGGPKTWENIVSCCHACNENKGARTPQEANMKLIKEPRRPKATFMDFYRLNHVPNEWSPYLYLYQERK